MIMMDDFFSDEFDGEQEGRYGRVQEKDRSDIPDQLSVLVACASGQFLACSANF